MNSYEEIYAVVRRIPLGRVSSYGRVAALAGHPGKPRLVGYALHSLRTTPEQADVPWWRVVNVAGRISNIYAPETQRQMLEHEGVQFNERGYVNMAVYVWEGDEALNAEC